VNYYEHHIGDYEQATAHLTACEDGIYSRLIRWYMASEAPLPSDIKLIQRRVRAHSRDEKSAVQTVLGEFFELSDDGYHQHRCDEEIARFRGKQEKARRSADARWSAVRTQTERNANASTETCERNANASTEHMHEGCERYAPRARPQTPDTRHQTPEYKRAHCADPPTRARAFGHDDDLGHDQTGPQSSDEQHPPTAAGVACLAMRHAGLPAVNPSDPRLLALLAQGATTDELADAAASAAAKGKPFGWALACVEGRRADASKIALATPKPRRNGHAHHADEPDWRREQRERNEAFLGPAAARRTKRSAEIIDMEATDAAPRQVG